MKIFQTKEFHPSGTEIIAPPAHMISVRGDFAGDAAAILATRGWNIGTPCDLIIETIRAFEPEMKKIPGSGRDSDEIYEVRAGYAHGVPSFTIRSAYSRGLRHALTLIEEMIGAGSFLPGTYFDYPAFTLRGVVEGFYGFPWKSDERKGIMALMERLRMNAYFYGPKNDAFHRENWGAPFAREDLIRLGRTAADAAGHGLDFYYCIGPGLTVKYSDERDLESIVAKARQAYDAGIRCFGLFLDDIPPFLQYDSDTESFSDLVGAHIAFVNRFYGRVRGIDPDIALALCPQQYCGKGTEDYITRIGQGIPADLRLMWTGPDICSKELAAADAATFRNSTGHKPLYWDNYPVNDADMYNEMHIGPLTGRDADLGDHCEGLLANCMEAAECTKIPLISIGAYLWDPAGYEPEAAFREALSEIAGEQDGEDLLFFADNLRVSCLKDKNASLLSDCLYKVKFLLKTGQEAAAATELESYLDKLVRCGDRFRTGLENSALQKELSRWIDKHFLLERILRSCLEYIETKETFPAVGIAESIDRYKKSATVYAGFCVEEFTDDLTGKFY